VRRILRVVPAEVALRESPSGLGCGHRQQGDRSPAIVDFSALGDTTNRFTRDRAIQALSLGPTTVTDNMKSVIQRPRREEAFTVPPRSATLQAPQTETRTRAVQPGPPGPKPDVGRTGGLTRVGLGPRSRRAPTTWPHCDSRHDDDQHRVGRRSSPATMWLHRRRFEAQADRVLLLRSRSFSKLRGRAPRRSRHRRGASTSARRPRSVARPAPAVGRCGGSGRRQR
jgi:hypothetical protein